MPDILGFRPLDWLQDVFNEGETYEKVPRLVPYVILPFAMALLLFRFVMAGIAIWRDRMDGLIASHEVEDAVDDAAKKLKDL